MAEGDISPWLPDQDRKRLAALGKLGEESGELATRACRCIIQGINELDPESGRTNGVELLREISDVVACIVMLDELGLLPGDFDFMDERVEKKVAGFRRWQGLIDAADTATTAQEVGGRA